MENKILSREWIYDNIFDLMCTNSYIKNESLFDSFFHDNQYTRDIVKKINLNQ